MQVPQIVRDTARSVDFSSTYRQALIFLEQCARIDEVKDFSDKVAAAAVYYRQKNDREAMNCMKRIQLNSAVQLGLLIIQIRERLKNPEHHVHAATEATQVHNLIRSQEQSHCVKIAALDKALRDEQIESQSPPSVSALAAYATFVSKPQPPPETPEQELKRERGYDRDMIICDIRDLCDLSEKFNAVEAAALVRFDPKLPEKENLPFDKLARLSQWIKALGST